MMTWLVRKIKKNRFVKALKLRKKGIFTKYPTYVSSNICVEKPIYINGESSIASSVSIGKYTYLQGSCRISPNVEIGRYCSIAGGVNIAPTNHPFEWLTTHPIAYNSEKYLGVKNKNIIEFQDHRKTIIGNDVWIGIYSIIKKGVVIGDGAVIGSGSIVTRDIPPYAIVAGVPAKVIKYRFEEEIIVRLLELEWWNLDEGDLVDIPWNNIKESIEIIESKKLEKNKR